MRKIISVLAAFLIMLVGVMPVYAANNIVGTSNADEILEADKELIEAECSDWLNEKTGLPIGEKTFAYNRSKCLYCDIDLFKNDYLNDDLMQKYISDENVYSVYELPAYFDGGTLVIDLVNGYEISDEDIEKMNDSEKAYFEKVKDRWHSQSHHVKTEHYDYISYIEGLLEQHNIDGANVYLVGGPNKALSPVLVICKGNESAQFLVLENDDYSGKLYSFDEMKEIALETSDNADSDGLIGNRVNSKSAQQGKIILLIVVIVIAAGLICGFVLNKKKRMQAK